MNSTALVIGLVGLILGGGGVGALLPVFRFRTDKGNVIAVGAEAAVQSLTVALQRSDARLEMYIAENAMLRVTIEDLRIKVETAENSLRTVSRDLASTRETLDQILKGKK